MKITVEIDNEAIEQNVTELVSKQLAAELYKELRGSRDMSLTYRYHVEVRKIIREVLKENYDALAKEAISKMDGVVPYSLARGNHDNSAPYNSTFNTDLYKSQFDGFYNDKLENAYKLMTLGE